MAADSTRPHVVLAVTGSIAAYKTAELTRALQRADFEVRIVMTESAAQFVSPLTLGTLSGQPVLQSFWNESDLGISHIDLADWADCMLVAPASADTIAKLAYGCADNPLLAVALATKAALVVCPSMNVNMLENAATQANLLALRERGIDIVRPESGELACGWVGTGRLPGLELIVAHVERALSRPALRSLKVLISAGPTREAIDPVRFISNRSSGKMGCALAREAWARGASVHVVHGPLSESLPPTASSQAVESAREMEDAMAGYIRSEAPEIVIMAAAVADYRPASAAIEKIKKTAPELTISCLRNPDILSSLAKLPGTCPLLVGFCVETGDERTLLESAKKKLIGKNLDLIVANRAEDAFDRDTNRVWLVRADMTVEELPLAGKRALAGHICDAVAALKKAS